jgi:hypothetical protein
MPEDKKTSRTDAGGFLVFCISRKQQICRNATGWAEKFPAETTWWYHSIPLQKTADICHTLSG